MQNFTFKIFALALGVILCTYNLSAQIDVTLSVAVEKAGTPVGTFEALAFRLGSARCVESLVGELALVTSDTSGTLACDSVLNDLTGKIAVIDRGVCAFSTKAINAQLAGAIGLIVINNATGALPTNTTGNSLIDELITIPGFVIGLEDGAILKANLEGASASITRVTPFPAFEEDNVFWGDMPNEGDFNGGLNDWTVVNYRDCAADDLEGGFPLWKWAPYGTARDGSFVGGGGYIESPTFCNGAMKFDSDFYDNNGVSDFGAGPCAANQLGALISPVIDLSGTEGADGLTLKFHQALRQFQSTYYVGWSIDGGMTWDSTSINRDVIVNSAHINEIARVQLPDSLLGQSNVRIKFTLDGNYYYWIIDDIRLVETNINVIDLGIADRTVAQFPLGAIPANQVEGNKAASFVPGAIVTNRGLIPAPNPEIISEITFTAGGETTTVYQDSASISILENDSTSNIIALSEFNIDTLVGNYTITYNISSDSSDIDIADNRVSANFGVTSNVFSKARFNQDTQQPLFTTRTTAAGGGSIEFIAGFNVPKGIGFRFDSTVFHVSIDAPNTLGGRIVEAYIYKWTDADNNRVTSTSEIEIVALAFQEFPANSTLTESTVKLDFFDFTTFEPGYIIPEDNQDYLMGIRYRGDGTFRFGFDGGRNLETYWDLEEERGTQNELNLPYVGVQDWIDDIIPNLDQGFVFNSFWNPISSALFINQITTDVDDLLATEEFELSLYPNPTSEVLTMSLKLEERTSYIEYEVTDIQGRRIFNQRKNGYVEVDNAVFNVTALPAGQYFFTVKTAQGNTTKSFAVKR